MSLLQCTQLASKHPVKSLAIPSGGGKTTLCSKYSQINRYNDLIDTVKLSCLKDFGNWNATNKYLRSINAPKDRILVTWAYETAPESYKPTIALLVNRKFNSRESEANAIVIKREAQANKLKLIEFNTLSIKKILSEVY